MNKPHLHLCHETEMRFYIISCHNLTKNLLQSDCSAELFLRHYKLFGASERASLNIHIIHYNDH